MTDPVYHTLTESPAEIVAQLLVDGSAGGFITNDPKTEPSWLVSVGGIPGRPAQVISCRDTITYRESGRLLNGVYIALPGIAVRARAETQSAAYRKSAAIHLLLQRVRRQNVTVNGVVFQVINVSPSSPPLYIGPDTDTEWVSYSFDVYLNARTVT